MAYDLIPSAFWSFPNVRLPGIFSDDDEEWTPSPIPSGISLSEDDKQVYVSVAMPGVSEKDVDMTFDKGTLWLKGETKEEEPDNKRKYYRKATSSFSYRVSVPGELDSAADPEASYANGVVTVTFKKALSSQPKKITIKSK